MPHVSVIVALVSLALVGCSSTPKLSVVPSQPGVVPVVSEEPAAPIPPPDELAGLVHGFTAVQRHATGKMVGSMLVYTSEPGQVHPVTTKTNHTTTLVWPVGEVIYHISGGEGVVTRTNDQGREEAVSAWLIDRTPPPAPTIPERLAIIPRAPGLTTNLTIWTNRRALVVELTSTAQKYMPLVAFWSDAPPAPPKRPAPRARVSLSGTLNIGYEIASTTPPPVWVVDYVWDDGVRTFLHCHAAMRTHELPMVYTKTPDGKTSLVNSALDPDGSTLIVDRLSRQWVLVLGNERVEVQRGQEYRQVQCPLGQGCPGAVTGPVSEVR